MEGMGDQGRLTGESSRDVMSSVKAAGADAKEEVKSSAREITASLRREGEGFVEQQKGRLSSEFVSLSRAARDAAQRCREQHCPNAAGYVDTFADKLQSAADYLETQSVGSLFSEMEDSARRHPQIFLGGMFLAGIVAGRFLRASSPYYPRYR